ncbi:MAG TPA: hypothetical protein VGM29_11320 [Polyangiaceae bacterium]|jgi:hypothetical protein
MVEVIRRRTRNVVPVPVEQVATVAELYQQLGPRGAAAKLGIGRGALLGVIASGQAMPGTLALLREALERRGRSA